MTAIESQLLQRLQKLPPNRLAEVVDFVDFLAAREERQAAARRLGESTAKLDALNLPPAYRGRGRSGRAGVQARAQA